MKKIWARDTMVKSNLVGFKRKHELDFPMNSDRL